MVDYKINRCIQFLFGGRESEEIRRQMGRKRTFQVEGLIMVVGTSTVGKSSRKASLKDRDLPIPASVLYARLYPI